MQIGLWLRNGFRKVCGKGPFGDDGNKCGAFAWNRVGVVDGFAYPYAYEFYEIRFVFRCECLGVSF